MVNGNTLRASIRNECICVKREVAPIEDKIRESIEIVWACVTQASKCTEEKAI